jgi:hypothetical protein
MDKHQKRLETEVQTRLELLYSTSLIQHIRGFGDRNRRYIDSKILDSILSKLINKPNNLEYIARDLAVYDSKNITPDDLLRYGQILEALKIAAVYTVSHSIVEEWATKLATIDINPGSFNYQENANERETSKEKIKSERTEKTKEIKEIKIALTMERENKEGNDKEKEITQDLQGVIGQIKDLSISAIQ